MANPKLRKPSLPRKRCLKARGLTPGKKAVKRCLTSGVPLEDCIEVIDQWLLSRLVSASETVYLDEVFPDIKAIAERYLSSVEDRIRASRDAPSGDRERLSKQLEVIGEMKKKVSDAQMRHGGFVIALKGLRNVVQDLGPTFPPHVSASIVASDGRQTKELIRTAGLAMFAKRFPLSTLMFVLHELFHHVDPGVFPLNGPQPFSAPVICLGSLTSVRAKSADISCYDSSVSQAAGLIAQVEELQDQGLPLPLRENIAQFFKKGGASLRGPDGMSDADLIGAIKRPDLLSYLGQLRQQAEAQLEEARFNPLAYSERGFRCQKAQFAEGFADWAALEAVVLEMQNPNSTYSREFDAERMAVYGELFSRPCLLRQREAESATDEVISSTPTHLLERLFLAPPAVRAALGCNEACMNEAPRYCEGNW